MIVARGREVASVQNIGEYKEGKFECVVKILFKSKTSEGTLLS